MAVYLISYDIKAKNSSAYKPLYAKLDGIKAINILESVWLAKNKTGMASSIYCKIARHTKSVDRLLVIEVTKDAVPDNLLIDDNEFNDIVELARG